MIMVTAIHTLKNLRRSWRMTMRLIYSWSLMMLKERHRKMTILTLRLLIKTNQLIWTFSWMDKLSQLSIRIPLKHSWSLNLSVNKTIYLPALRHVMWSLKLELEENGKCKTPQVSQVTNLVLTCKPKTQGVPHNNRSKRTVECISAGWAILKRTLF